MTCPECGYKPGRGDPAWCTWCDRPLVAGPPWWEFLGVWLAIVVSCLFAWWVILSLFWS